MQERRYEATFGNLFGVDAYRDAALAKYPRIAFNAYSHAELMRLAYDDLERLVYPKLL